MIKIGIIALTGLVLGPISAGAWASEIHCHTDGSHFIGQGEVDLVLAPLVDDADSYQITVKTDHYGRKAEYVSAIKLGCVTNEPDPLLVECREKKDPRFAARPVSFSRHVLTTPEDGTQVHYEAELLLSKKQSDGTLLADGQYMLSPRFIPSECEVH